MASRKWLVRSLYLAFLATLAGGGLCVYAWMRPEFIRIELTRQLADRFNSNVDIEVSSAHLRLLGGIAINDLKLIRRDDPTHTPLLAVPSAILHHDKEQLNNGKLIIRKVEMYKPRLLVERDAKGNWNFLEIIKPPRDDEPLPIFILHQATIVFIDHRNGDQPLAEWNDVEATIINDPVMVFAFQLQGVGRPTGSFVIEGKFDTRSGFAGSVDLPNLSFGPQLTSTLELCNPAAAEYMKPLTGRASAHLDLAWRAGSAPVLYHDLAVQLRNCRYDHPGLPHPVEQIDARFRSRNGDITVEKATARLGQASVSFSMDLPRSSAAVTDVSPHMVLSPGQSLSSEPAQLQEIENRMRHMEMSITNLAVTPELFDRLPGKAPQYRSMLAPSGPLSAKLSFHRNDGRWHKRMVLEPAGMAAKYSGFPYQMRNVRGNLVYTVSEGSNPETHIDLSGDAIGSTVSIKGSIKGRQPDVDVDLQITGKGVTLDDELINAMPDDHPELLRRLHATAHGDFEAFIRHNERIRREYGPETFANHFNIRLKQGSMKFDEFPYPLENMTGTLVVRTVPDRPTRLPNAQGMAAQPLQNADTTTLEFHDFRATRNGAVIRGHGRKDPAPGGSVLQLNINAEALAMDSDLQRALAAIRVENAWQTFGPTGRVNFGVWAKLYSKSDPHAVLNPAEDLELRLAFTGATIKPTFFPYILHDLTGKVAYAKGRAEFKEFKAKHGQSEIGLPTAEVLFRPSGGYWADLRDLRANPLVLDEPFREALPIGLRSGVESLEFRGPLALQVSRMVIDEQPGPFLPRELPGAARGAAPSEPEPARETASVRSLPKQILPTIYWDGRLTLAGASMKTGVEWENVHGAIASWGLYKGDHLGAVRGNISFDRASVAKQPVEAVTASMRVDPRQPDILSVPSIRGKLYGGDIGGEAWVMLDSPVRYALQLNAARVNLADFARQYKLPAKSHLEGLATAQLYLSNRPDERTGQLVLQGTGSLDVPSGKLLNLPVLLNLIKVVKLRMPDDTGFEEAHALLHLRGDRVRFSQLDLIGNAISLGGEGEMRTDGADVYFEFYPVWTKLKEMFALPGDWTGAISKKFLKIKVTGDLDGKLDYRAEPVPDLVNPVRRVIERLK